MKIRSTALILTLLIPFAALAQVPDDASKAIVAQARAIRADSSISNAEKLTRIAELATQPDLPAPAREFLTGSRLNLLAVTKQFAQVIDEADAFLASNPVDPTQRYAAASTRLSATPPDEKLAFATSDLGLTDTFAAQLELAAVTQVANALAQTDPKAAFDYLLSSPVWTMQANLASGISLQNTVSRLAELAASARQPDALQWAYANYAICDLARINHAIDIVTQAFRAQDENVIRANAYIEYQKTGAGENPLANQGIPQSLAERLAAVNLTETHTASRVAILIAQGDFEAALDVAKTDYATAPRATLSRAVDRIAAVLKAHDGNVIRANAYIQSQKDQTPFDLTLE